MENAPSIISILILGLTTFGVIGWFVYEAQVLFAARKNIQEMASSENQKRDERIAEQQSRLNSAVNEPMVRRAV